MKKISENVLSEVVNMGARLIGYSVIAVPAFKMLEKKMNNDIDKSYELKDLKKELIDLRLYKARNEDSKLYK